MGGGGGVAQGRTRAVSDLIITDYHSSPAIKAKASPSLGNSPNNAGNEKRIMSGLSLAMMADENGNNSQQQHHQTAVGGDGCGMPISPDEYSEQVDTVVEHTWGSLATRAAFHHPPPTYESPGTTSDDFFQYHRIKGCRNRKCNRMSFPSKQRVDAAKVSDQVRVSRTKTNKNNIY